MPLSNSTKIIPSWINDTQDRQGVARVLGGHRHRRGHGARDALPDGVAGDDGRMVGPAQCLYCCRAGGRDWMVDSPTADNAAQWRAASGDAMITATLRHFALSE